MGIKYRLNIEALRTTAERAGDLRNGEFYITGMAKRTGIDGAVLSRVLRGKNGPDLRTLLSLGVAYGLTVEQLLQIGEESAVPVAA